MTLPWHGPVKTVACTRNEYPAAASTTPSPSSAHAVSHAVLMASVSSATPSPTAPKSFTTSYTAAAPPAAVSGAGAGAAPPAPDDGGGGGGAGGEAPGACGGACRLELAGPGAWEGACAELCLVCLVWRWWRPCAPPQRHPEATASARSSATAVLAETSISGRAQFWTSRRAHYYY